MALIDLINRKYPLPHSAVPRSVVTPRPPAGTYDPALDAAYGAAERGYGDFQFDTGRAGERAFDDYEIGKGDITRRRDETLADLGRGHTRFGEDLGTAREGVERGYARTGEDYQSALGGLLRQYQRLGNQQGERSRSMGGSTGVLAQALRKRTENQAIDRKPLDTGYARAGEDRGTALAGLMRQETREGEDYGTQTTRTNDAATRGLGELALGFRRGNEDRTTGLTRAGRELGYFGLDTAASRFYQAAQSGLWNPPAAGTLIPASTGVKKKPAAGSSAGYVGKSTFGAPQPYGWRYPSLGG